MNVLCKAGSILK